MCLIESPEVDFTSSFYRVNKVPGKCQLSCMAPDLCARQRQHLVAFLSLFFRSAAAPSTTPQASIGLTRRLANVKYPVWPRVSALGSART